MVNRLFNTDKIKQYKFSGCLCLEITSASIYDMRKIGLVERGSRINLRRVISYNQEESNPVQNIAIEKYCHVIYLLRGEELNFSSSLIVHKT